MYMYGTPHKVVVDDGYAVENKYNHSILSPGYMGRWGQIMEKAAGKYYGTFENMHGGMEYESIYAMTGVPSF